MIHMCMLCENNYVLRHSFDHLVPMCAISIGFCINSIPTVGVVFAPFIGGEGEHFRDCIMTSTKVRQVPCTLLSITPEGEHGCLNLDLVDRWQAFLWFRRRRLFLEAPKGIYAFTSLLSSLASDARVELRCIYLGEWGKDRRDFPGSNLEKRSINFTNMAAEIGGRDGRGGMVHGIRSLGR